MTALRILLVDDHRVIRDGIKSYFEDGDAFEVVAEANDGIEALALLQEHPVDLVLMDINMDNMDGITACKEISKLYPHIKILALTMMTESQYIKKMMNSGASGYMLKNCDEKEVKYAIGKIMAGEHYYSQDVTQIILGSISKQPPPPKSRFIVETPLTEREKEVLELILKEFTNKEIAETLYISMRTVDAHKRNLLEKTGSKNLAGLALYAVNRQLFEDI